MKKKIIALQVLTLILIGNGLFVANAKEWSFKHELTHNNTKLQHIPFWLAPSNNQFTKSSRTECKKGSISNLLNENGNVKSKFIDTNCNFKDKLSDANQNMVIESQESKKKMNKESDEEMNDFLENLFNGSTEGVDSNTNSESEQSSSTGSTQSGTGYINNETNDFINNLFSEDLEAQSNYDENINFALKGKELSQTIKDFVGIKKLTSVNNINVVLVKGDSNYNSKMKGLLQNVDSNFKIDSIKQDFAKHISSLSYTYATFALTGNSKKIQGLFKKKFIQDVSKLKKRYKIFKKKDRIISKTLTNRGEL